MPYSTQPDLQKKISLDELVQLTDDLQVGSVDVSAITEAILDADELIDSYVGKVKAVPLSPVPGLVKTLSANIAIWNLHVRRGVENDARLRAYEDAVKTLRLIADGKIVLGAQEAALPVQTTEGGVVSSTAGKSRVFTDDSLGGF